MKMRISDYTFNKTAKTITFNGFSAIKLEGISVISNVLDGIMIFNFVKPGLTGTVATNVLTLAHDTTSMDDTDPLEIFYDDGGGPPQHHFLTLTANTNTQIAAGASNTTHVVTAITVFLDNASTTDADFELFSNTTAIMKRDGIAKGSGFVLGTGEAGIFETAKGEALKYTPAGLSATNKMNIHVTYYSRIDP